MTKRDFFRIVIKLFGLYSLIASIFQLLPTFYAYASHGFDQWTIMLVVAFTALIVFIYVFLIKKVDVVIDWLDKGFDDEKIEIGNFNSVKIVSFATILIGGFLIVNYFPTFLYQCYLAFKSNLHTGSLDPSVDLFNYGPQYFDFVLSILNMVIGYLLLTNYRGLAFWLTQVNAKNNA